MINLVVLPLVLAGLLSSPEFVQCHLAKRVKIQKEMVCIYRGPNGTLCLSLANVLRHLCVGIHPTLRKK